METCSKLPSRLYLTLWGIYTKSQRLEQMSSSVSMSRGLLQKQPPCSLGGVTRPAFRSVSAIWPLLFVILT